MPYAVRSYGVRSYTLKSCAIGAIWRLNRAIRNQRPSTLSVAGAFWVVQP